MEKITRDSWWGSYNGSRTVLKDFDDTHLLNMVGYLGDRIKKTEGRLEGCSDILLEMRLERIEIAKGYLEVVHELIEERNLTVTAEAEKANIPFLDKKKGKYLKIDLKTSKLVTVPKSVMFVKGLAKKED